MSQKSLTSLKKLKHTVLRGRDLEIETSGVEVAELQKQKAILLDEVKEICGVFFGLKKAREEVEGNMEDYSISRVMALEYIAREVSDELRIQAEDVSKHKKMTDNTIKELELVRIDLVEREELLGTEVEKLNTRTASLAEKENALIQRQQDVSKMQGKLGGKMGKLAKKEKDIDVLYIKAEKLVLFFEEQADKEREALIKKDASLKRREVDVKAAKVAIDIRDKDLTQRRRWIKDREATVRMLIGHYDLDKDKIPKHFKK